MVKLVPAVLVFYILISYQSIDVIALNLIDEIREAELKIVTLESVLEESISIVDSKNIHIKETEILVKKLTAESDHLQSVSLTMKNDSNETLNGLEEEVRLLWGTARRNNFELHSLESKAQDAESRLEVIKSRVEMLAEIVNQQWIQIQHLEQALVIAQKGSEEIVSRCFFLKFFKRGFFIKCPEILEATWSKIKQNHHQLQGFVKKEMQKGKYTAALANKEVVFFLASALITFPALSLGVFLLSNFC
ncbi:uncharacterized protein LOC143569523 [Bidens hawaiensis]|uniref:uncharacterized protein LOC143569523 n=1 Tax=Bidens hawaiensis TaxID=980011 RepID=UPI00404AC2B1